MSRRKTKAQLADELERDWYAHPRPSKLDKTPPTTDELLGELIAVLDHVVDEAEHAP